MNRDSIQSGNAKHVAAEAYHIVEALDNIELPGDKVRALSLVLSVMGDVLSSAGFDPKALITLGDNIRQDLKHFEPDTYKALHKYIVEEMR